MTENQILLLTAILVLGIIDVMLTLRANKIKKDYKELKEKYDRIPKVDRSNIRKN